MGRYGLEFFLVKELGLSWQDIETAPKNVIEEFFIRANADNEFANKKKEFDDNK